MDKVATTGVFFFSKSNCKFCVALEEDLLASGTEYIKYKVTCAKESAHIKASTGRDTYPILYINKNLVGGYNEYRTLALTNQIACDF